MVNRLKLNEKALRDAEPKPGVRYQVFDTEVNPRVPPEQAQDQAAHYPTRFEV